MPTLARVLGHHRAVGCSAVNTGLHASLCRRGVVRALSCGHNHYNDYVGRCRGDRRAPYLCFGRISGLSPPTTWEHDGGALPFLPGGRVMAVKVAHRLVTRRTTRDPDGDALVSSTAEDIEAPLQKL